MDKTSPPARLPPWIKASLPGADGFNRIRGAAAARGLNTVCASARCPNRGECWGSGTATFMILGASCTRSCRFCSVDSAARPPAPAAEEPADLARTVSEMGLRYAVLTAVCRDDLPDQGAGHVAACIRALKTSSPGLKVEALIPDFGGSEPLIRTVLDAAPDAVGHNLETVERLTGLVRDRRAGYRLSLDVLAALRRLRPALPIKSSLMLGLGETTAETAQALGDLRRCGANFLTLGQYLRPTAGERHLPVVEYVTPRQFRDYARLARRLGFEHVSAGPFVRSSYRAAEASALTSLSPLGDKPDRPPLRGGGHSVGGSRPGEPHGH